MKKLKQRTMVVIGYIELVQNIKIKGNSQKSDTPIKNYCSVNDLELVKNRG